MVVESPAIKQLGTKSAKGDARDIPQALKAVKKHMLCCPLRA